jgi:hypothetical protein
MKLDAKMMTTAQARSSAALDPIVVHAGAVSFAGRAGSDSYTSAPFEETIWLVSRWQDRKSIWPRAFGIELGPRERFR